MATLEFKFETGNIPISRIVNAIATYNGYQDTAPSPLDANVSIPNPETKQQFAKKVIKDIIISMVKAQEINEIKKVAEEQAKNSVTPISLT